MTQPLQDHFSDRADAYAQFRPRYPTEFVDWLAAQSRRRARAGPLTVWEAGCGSGQLTVRLSGRFDRLMATDASAEQLARAPALPGVEYRQARAEACGLPDASVDLAVSAQAAHWFDPSAYYREVRRVVRPGGLIAMAVYGALATGEPEMDRLTTHFHRQTLKEFWPPQRQHVDTLYQSLEFPFDAIPTPAFELRETWSLDQWLGYVETWSATAALARSGGRGTIDDFYRSIARLWGMPGTTRAIRWPLALRLGCVDRTSVEPLR
jgi:SAM-dependent methyltransferase